MKKSKKILYAIILILVVVGCSISYYYYSESTNYFVTDNAKITAKMYNITALSVGKLTDWNFKSGDTVMYDEVLGRQENSPHLKSPIDGTIVKSDVIIDQILAPGSLMAIIADTNNMYIGANIEETNISKIAVGQKVDVKIDAYKGKTFTGFINEVNPTTQTFLNGTQSFNTSGTYTKVVQLIPIKITIDNSDNLPLILGMNATIKIHVK